jgi:NADPH:quinone reductase
MFEPCIQALGIQGRQISITSIGDGRVDFNLLDFYHRRLTLFGVDTRELDSVACAGLLEKLNMGFEECALRPPQISKRYRLDQAVEAYQQVEAGTGGGKAVFVLGS